MKKLLSIFMVAMLAVVCSISLISCGGDKEDDGPDIPSTATYYEPCFDWGSNVDHVKAYMAGWQLMDGSNDYVLVYTNSKSTTNVNYSFIGGNGLSMVSVTYIAANAQNIISEIQKHHGIKMTKDDASSSSGDTVYSGTGTIGGRTTAVLLHSTSATVTVIYGIAE